MKYSNLRYNFARDLIEFSVSTDDKVIDCKIDELWMDRECNAAVTDWTGARDEPLKKAFVDQWPKIEKILSRKIEQKQFESDGTIYLR
jgi:hypothetical protein